MANVQIDHFMWGAPDLDQGIDEAERLFGVRAAPGGSHPGLGTRNALLSLGDSVYLEIIAPDPEQKLEETFGERLGSLETCELITWAARSNKLETLSRELTESGLNCRGPVRTKRNTPAGELLVWDLLFCSAPDYGGTFPFFIDWLECPHPAISNPSAGSFNAMRITSPQVVPLRATIKSLGLEVAVQQGKPALAVEIDVGDSRVTLTSSAQSMALRLG